ncbi:receptor-like protein 35 [Brassica napus]|nr:receptor-like protein 35 [Brassica napus]
MTTSLDILDIANNNLNGSAPECFWNLTAKSLSVLDIGDNHFTGSLPDIFKNATNLRSLNLGYNHFVGKLPRSLTSCSSLEVLNVEHNRFDDTFPFWLQSLNKLQVLILRSNEFHGLLQYQPQGPSWFPQLRIIDLSHNEFTGTLLDDFFIYLSAMSSKGDSPKFKYIGGNSYYRDSMVLMNKGVELEYTRIFTLLTAIDFSGNKLQGEIPESIGLLKDLIVLNLSSNGFNGNIPSSLGNLTQLESLDLSHNELSGQIPPALRDLTKLSFIKVSHNELVGPIPRSTQFQTQSASSFQGNRGLCLCGPPLNENCGDKEEPSQTEEKEEEDVISWIAAAIGLAPGFIFGMTIGHVVIISKPQWFMVRKKTRRIALGRFSSESPHQRNPR